MTQQQQFSQDAGHQNIDKKHIKTRLKNDCPGKDLHTCIVVTDSVLKSRWMPGIKIMIKNILKIVQMTPIRVPISGTSR